jgi:hypothetical protein
MTRAGDVKMPVHNFRFFLTVARLAGGAGLPARASPGYPMGAPSPQKVLL